MVRNRASNTLACVSRPVIDPVPVPVGEHERRDVREAVRHGGPLYGVDGSIFEEHHWPTSVVGGKRLEMVQEQPLVLLLQRIHAHHRRGRHLREREPGADADHIELEVFPQVRYRREGHRRTGEALDAVIADGPGWEGLGDLVARVAALAKHGRVGPVEPRVGRLQPLPPLHAANAAHAGHRGVARGQAVAGSRRRPAQRRPGAADRLPAAEFEVEPAAAHPIRSPPVGDGGVVPPARRVPRRRHLAGAVAALRRYQGEGRWSAWMPL